ncbi:MAG: D-glycero-beta-D-manno-heptose 1,7-bisphosphate 7-phosphatase [Fibrobacterota bacterium]
MSGESRPALFLDRDGVVNVEKNYVHRIDQFEFMDGIFELCNAFQNAGYAIVVVTNQAGIARGYYTVQDMERLHAWMIERFAERGVVIAGVYHCPHHPEFSGPCECRKPKAGMILRARDELGIDLTESVLLGDKESDLEAGRAAGIRHLALLVDGPRGLERVRAGSGTNRSVKSWTEGILG